MKTHELLDIDIFTGKEARPNLLEKIILAFSPRKKKILIDTDSGSRELYSLEYKTLKGTMFIINLKEGIR